MSTALAIVEAEQGAEIIDYAYLELLGRVKKALDSAQDLSLPATDIRPYAGQPREHFDEVKIAQLSNAIDLGGQTTKGLIRHKPAETPYELIDGERRWRAIMLIPAERRPLYKASVIEADDDVIQFLIAGIANFNRVGHTPVEIMRTIDQYHVGFKIPMKEIAGLLGISEMWAYAMHGLKNLAPPVLAMLDPELPKDKLLPVTAAIQISKIEPKHQMGLAVQVLNKSISLTKLRSEVVKVAKREGSYVRVREVSPLKQWESFGNKLEVILRMTGDSKTIFDKREIDLLIKNRPSDTAKMLKKIRDAVKMLNTLDEHLDKLLD